MGGQAARPTTQRHHRQLASHHPPGGGHCAVPRFTGVPAVRTIGGCPICDDCGPDQQYSPWGTRAPGTLCRFHQPSKKDAARPHCKRQAAHQSGHDMEAHVRPHQRPLPAPPSSGRHPAALPVRDVPALLLRGATPRPTRCMVGPLAPASRSVGPVGRCPPRVWLHQPHHPVRRPNRRRDLPGRRRDPSAP